jgi:hypothetical protein
MIRFVFASLAVLVVLFGCRSGPENQPFVEFLAQHPYWIQESINWELPSEDPTEYRNPPGSEWTPKFECASGVRILRFDTAGEYNFTMVNPFELYHSFDQGDSLEIGSVGFNKWRGHWRSGGDSLELRFAVYYRDIPVSIETSPGEFEPEQVPGDDTTVAAIIHRPDSGQYVIEAFGLRFISHDAWTERSLQYLRPYVEPIEGD